jgi:hypothetical protein
MWLEKWTPDWKVISALFTPNPRLSNIRFNTDEHTLIDYILNELSCRWGSRPQNVCKLKSGTNWAHSPLLDDRSGFLGTELVPVIHSDSTEDISPRFTKLVKKYPNTCLRGLVSISLTYQKSQLANCWIPCEFGFLKLTPSSRKRIERNLDVAIISEQHATLGCQGGRIWCTFNLSYTLVLGCIL